MSQAPLGDITVASIRGMNDTESPLALPETQCVLAENVEFFTSALGERRQGCNAVDLTGSGLTTQNTIVFVSQWLPTNDPNNPEWWIVAASVGASTKVARRRQGIWTAVMPSDPILPSLPNIYTIGSHAHHSIAGGLLFFAYLSEVDRFHAWDGAVLRRSGLAQPSAAPAVTDEGAGAYASVRYFRTRFIEQNPSGQILRRSEPSLSTKFTPSGGGAGARIPRPTLLGEGETHWEMEASVDNATFYRIQTLSTGSTSANDETASTVSYNSLGPLSEAVGTYLLIPSVAFFDVDGDRLFLGGHQTDVTRQSSVYWTPPSDDPGVGNNERLPLNKNNTVNLDGGSGGAITGVCATVLGTVFVFKWSTIYQATRTYDAAKAYEIVTASPTHGALPGSVIGGVDENGTSCTYFLDPLMGPARISSVGLQFIGGLRSTWKRVNVGSTGFVAAAAFYPFKLQMKWWVPVDGGSTPGLGLTLQTDKTSWYGGGHGSDGWSLITGRMAQAYAVGVLSETVIDGGMTVLRTVPFIGLTGADLLQRCEAGDTDAGTTYTAKIVTRPYLPVGLLYKWGGMVGALLAGANPTRHVKVSLVRDFGVETSAAVEVNLTPEAVETLTTKLLDDLSLSEAHALQIVFSD